MSILISNVGRRILLTLTQRDELPISGRDTVFLNEKGQIVYGPNLASSRTTPVILEKECYNDYLKVIDTSGLISIVYTDKNGALYYWKLDGSKPLRIGGSSIRNKLPSIELIDGLLSLAYITELNNLFYVRQGRDGLFGSPTIISADAVSVQLLFIDGKPTLSYINKLGILASAEGEILTRIK